MDPAKPPFADDATSRANDNVVRLAFREMRVFLGRSRFWIILGGAIVIVAFAGPFYTLERMTFPARLMYWGYTAILSGVLMTFLSMLVRRIAFAYGIHWLPSSLLAGSLGILPVMALVHWANALAYSPESSGEFLSLFPFVAAPVLLITVLVNWFLPDGVPLEGASDTQAAAGNGSDPEPSSSSLADAEQPSVLFSKLPASLGREIVTLQAKDHYIEVTTPLGNALVLMRLSDAEQDLAALDGMRVHRSWWISLAHVDRIEKGTSGPELRMATGHAVPIARGQRVVVREKLAQR